MWPWQPLSATLVCKAFRQAFFFCSSCSLLIVAMRSSIRFNLTLASSFNISSSTNLSSPRHGMTSNLQRPPNLHHESLCKPRENVEAESPLCGGLYFIGQRTCIGLPGWLFTTGILMRLFSSNRYNSLFLQFFFCHLTSFAAPPFSLIFLVQSLFLHNPYLFFSITHMLFFLLQTHVSTTALGSSALVSSSNCVFVFSTSLISSFMHAVFLPLSFFSTTVICFCQWH